jgi:TrmH family RNA methyltransferase
VLSRNRIKYLSSLKIKKFRNLHGQFIIEGDKIIRDILQNGIPEIRQLIATPEWLADHQSLLSEGIGEIAEAEAHDLSRISALETPAPVMIVMDIPQVQPDWQEISNSWSLVLDNIQDPGNVGTIIRSADWFGIRNIICSASCADCFSPKVVQASMGALLNLKVHYADLTVMMERLSHDAAYKIYGTFMQGMPVYELTPAAKGLIVFGNEARGISKELLPFIQARITIPPVKRDRTHVESLNVASSVAILCAWLIRN